MSLTPIQSTDNTQVPGIYGYEFKPDQLIVDGKNLTTQPILIAAGTYKRGTVLGLKSAYPVEGAAVAGNTGNGTLTNLVTANPKIGVYTLTATSDTVFALVDPEGNAVANVTVGTAYSDAEIGLLISAGATAFVAGDAFTVTVYDAVGVYVESVRTATDGSQEPSAILVDNVSSTDDVTAAGYMSGEFNLRALTFDASWTPALLTQALRKYQLLAKSSVSGAPPSNNSAP